ncbi:MAG: 1-deoxy-D-xylulose-5-phosphate reductoisomerase [Planctomycetales bacterium]|nr:1-deoxy-D-xylulose-5-phosphate reductoisomerase [Planctomycetales bacterium]
MPQPQTNVVVLGSTGSVGRNTLEVIESSPNLSPIALSTNTRLDLAAEQCRKFKPRWLIATCEESVGKTNIDLPPETELVVGMDSLVQVVAHEAVDTVVAAIVGSAGLHGTVAALQAGKRVAFANKETLVMAGSLVMKIAAEHNAELLPVDSEHSAIFQALAGGQKDEIKRILLTASGGPFREYTSQQMDNVTVEEALDHPTWDMGPKITIDSSTMMNKALEIVEARWLFDIAAEQIDVVIHPQSIVHSMVEFVDGSVIAQLSPPDMKLPIQYALTYPERTSGAAPKLDWSTAMTLEFMPPDRDRFPSLDLGFEVARAGGTAGAVVNAANEAAVQGFLDGKLRFAEIVPACKSVLEQHNYDPNPTLDQLIKLDQWAREEVFRWVIA